MRRRLRARRAHARDWCRSAEPASRRPRASIATDPAPRVFSTNTDTLSFRSILLTRLGCSCANSSPPSVGADDAVRVVGALPHERPPGAGSDHARNRGDRHFVEGAGGTALRLPLRARRLAERERRARQPYENGEGPGHDLHLLTCAFLVRTRTSRRTA